MFQLIATRLHALFPLACLALRLNRTSLPHSFTLMTSCPACLWAPYAIYGEQLRGYVKQIKRGEAMGTVVSQARR